MTKETRKSKRAPAALRVRFRAASVEQFIEQQKENLSSGGIFIRSKSPLARGTLMVFDFQLQDGAPLLKGVGRVVWARKPDAIKDGEPPGMGIKFIRVEPESLSTFQKIMSGKRAAEGGRDVVVSLGADEFAPPVAEDHDRPADEAGEAPMVLQGRQLSSRPPANVPPEQPTPDLDAALEALTGEPSDKLELAGNAPVIPVGEGVLDTEQAQESTGPAEPALEPPLASTDAGTTNEKARHGRLKEAFSTIKVAVPPPVEPAPAPLGDPFACLEDATLKEPARPAEEPPQPAEEPFEEVERLLKTVIESPKVEAPAESLSPEVDTPQPTSTPPLVVPAPVPPPLSFELPGEPMPPAVQPPMPTGAPPSEAVAPVVVTAPPAEPEPPASPPTPREHVVPQEAISEAPTYIPPQAAKPFVSAMPHEKRGGKPVGVIVLVVVAAVVLVVASWYLITLLRVPSGEEAGERGVQPSQGVPVPGAPGPEVAEVTPPQVAPPEAPSATDGAAVQGDAAAAPVDRADTGAPPSVTPPETPPQPETPPPPETPPQPETPPPPEMPPPPPPAVAPPMPATGGRVLVITSTPTGTLVSVNSRSFGRTPVTLTDRDVALDHTLHIRLSRRGHLNWDAVIEPTDPRWTSSNGGLNMELDATLVEHGGRSREYELEPGQLPPPTAPPTPSAPPTPPAPVEENPYQ
jgi:uncharacterized protein (TIGR02266 family)